MAGGIGRASMMLASGTMVSRVLGFVKAIVLAGTIGVVGSASADAFANATQLPSNIYSLIAGGVLNAVLVPQVVRAARHDDGGQGYVNRLVTLSIALLGGLALLMTIAVPIISRLYGASLSSEQLALVIAFAYWCMPQIFFYGLYSVLGEVLNARGLFGPFAWAPVINNIVGIAGLIVFSVLFGPDPTGSRAIAEWSPAMIGILGGSATLGVAIQALFLFVFWRRVGLTFRPDFHWKGTGLGQAGRLASWTFGMLLVLQFSGLVETIIANIAFGVAASVAAFQNAFLIYVLPHSIVTVSIATAYFTRMSTAASEGRMRDLVRDFSGGTRLIGLFIVFSSFGLAVIAPAFARIFESTDSGVTAMATILVMFLIGLVPYSGLFLVLRAFYALEDTRTQFWLFLGTMPLHIFGMAIVSTLPVENITAGLALMQSIMSTLRLLILVSLLRKRVGHLDGRRIGRSYATYTIAAIAAAAVGLVVMWMLGTYETGGFARSGIAAAIVSCVVGGVIMVAVYLVALLLMRSGDLREALEPLLARFGRGPSGGAGEGGAGEGTGEGPGQPPAPSEGPEPEEREPELVPGGQAPYARPPTERSPEASAGIDSRDEGLYAANWASYSTSTDLSTAGILLPLHPTSEIPLMTGAAARTRRERREAERLAIAALAERRAREAAERAAAAPAAPAERASAEASKAVRADDGVAAERLARLERDAQAAERQRASLARHSAQREAANLAAQRDTADRTAEEARRLAAAEHLHRERLEAQRIAELEEQARRAAAEREAEAHRIELARQAAARKAEEAARRGDDDPIESDLLASWFGDDDDDDDGPDARGPRRR